MSSRMTTGTLRAIGTFAILVLLALPVSANTDAGGGLDGDPSTFYAWFTSLQEWVVDLLLDEDAPSDGSSDPKAPVPEDQECLEGCTEQFPTTDPNG